MELFNVSCDSKAYLLQALTCPPGRWLCANKKCVPASYVCDGDEDCGDGSDEIKCHGGKPQIDNIRKCIFYFIADCKKERETDRQRERDRQTDRQTITETKERDRQRETE